MKRADFLIIGQGLAGTALAWRLLERGRSFLIVDRNEPLTSSKVAAGLVTPITGMRLSVNWNFESLYPEALMFYRRIEKRLGVKFYFPRPYVRLFKDELERDLWNKRAAEDSVTRLAFAPTNRPLVDESVFANPIGGFRQKHAGYLDTAAYLEASRRFFESLVCWAQAEIKPEDIDLGGDQVRWRGVSFDAVVFCQGAEAAKHPLFDWVPFAAARGTVLSLQADIEGRHIVNHGCWLLSREDGTFRAGATYELRFVEPHTPGILAMKDLQQRLASLLKVKFRITGSQTAVRPIVKRRRALIGRHPGDPRAVFFNGLGSKGVLRAPFIARRLTEHLLDGAPLDVEFDLQANL